jgi:peptide/nickel transport system substrate-binding protein
MTYNEIKQLYMARKIDRRSFLAGAAAVGALGAASTFTAGNAMAQMPKKGGSFRIGKAHGQTTDTLDPGTSENGFTTPLLHGIYSYLTMVGVDGSVQPDLAESWEASDDASVWTFNIRQGVTFHDGRPLTVEDVIVSINHHRGADSTSAAGPIVKPIQNIRSDGPTKVVFELEAGNADFPYILTDYHLPIGPAKDGKLDWKAGNGTGVYKLDEFKPGISAAFTRNENHWDPDRGFFDDVTMLSLVDLNARTTALVSGEVHAIDRLDLKTVGLLGRRPGININSVAGTQHFTFAMSCNQDPYTDVNVRRALKYAINREEMVEKILFGYGSVGNDHPIGPGQRFYNDQMAQTSYDPDKAKFYLNEAGMDSLKVKLSASDAAFGGAVDAAVLYQNSAMKAGIDIEVVREPNDGYWSDVWMVKPFSAVYWSGRPVEDQMFSTAYQSGVAWNDTFWSNERFDELLVMARAELVEERRREMYFEMQEIVNQDGGAVIPMFANYVFATLDEVNTGDLASNQDVDGERWMERWSFA